ncbi:MAG: hypothetical protein HC834_06145 [Rhodospirillales bacterium]|nr:hypothetical protein [Rhodospirillales bacterium]
MTTFLAQQAAHGLVHQGAVAGHAMKIRRLSSPPGRAATGIGRLPVCSQPKVSDQAILCSDNGVSPCQAFKPGNIDRSQPGQLVEPDEVLEQCRSEIPLQSNRRPRCL